MEALHITRDERDALYREASDLSDSGDIALHMLNGETRAAQLLADRITRRMRLLDDLGWSRTDYRSAYVLTQPTDGLGSVLVSIREGCAAALADTMRDIDPDDPELSELDRDLLTMAARDEQTIATCDRLLSRIGAALAQPEAVLAVA